MRADVFEAAFATSTGQLPLPVGAQTFVGAAHADAALEHRIDPAVCLAQVGGDDPGRFEGGSLGHGNGDSECRKPEDEAIYV